MTTVVALLDDLKEGEEICRECEGSGCGDPVESLHDDLGLGVAIKCSHCFGEGKLDWIENIIGKHIFPCMRCGGLGREPIQRGGMRYTIHCPDCRGNGRY